MFVLYHNVFMHTVVEQERVNKSKRKNQEMLFVHLLYSPPKSSIQYNKILDIRRQHNLLSN